MMVAPGAIPAPTGDGLSSCWPEPRVRGQGSSYEDLEGEGGDNRPASLHLPQRREISEAARDQRKFQVEIGFFGPAGQSESEVVEGIGCGGPGEQIPGRYQPGCGGGKSGKLGQHG